MPGSLDGVRVLDLTRALAGPYCSLMLGDMGAEVVKVELPGSGDETRGWGPPFIEGESTYFMSISRNKQSITLNLKNGRSREVLRRLVERSDVLVENMRPGAMGRLGFGYDEAHALNPRLIYCSISGFGQTGPRREEAGYDAVAQAEGGLMSITGPEDGPGYRLGVAVSDIVSGMFAVQGITLALLARERTGRGQHVDIGMLDATAALLTYQAAIFFATGQTPPRMGNRHPTIAPYETFESSDGEFVIAVGNDEQWRRFCAAIEAPALASDERFTTNRLRLANYDTLRPMLAEHLRRRTRAEWGAALKAAGVPCGSVRRVGEVLSDPQLAARGMIQEIEHPVAGAIRALGNPVQLSDMPRSAGTPPPTLGQHTDRILREDAGLSDAEISTLRSQKAI